MQYYRQTAWSDSRTAAGTDGRLARQANTEKDRKRSYQQSSLFRPPSGGTQL